MFRPHISFLLSLCLLCTVLAAEAWLVRANVDSTSTSAIVIGFVGGFVSPDDQVHSEVELATRLRQDYPSGVYVKVFNNRHTEEAYGKILELLDTSHGGKLTDDEKRNARIILYGHSWGGSAAIKLARRLGAAGIS
jgi:hypothetical protein